MTAGALGRSWALASILVAATLIFLARTERWIDREALGRPVVVIGSSLLLHAVPASLPEKGGLLGDGRGHTRVAIQQISEEQTLSLLSQAMEAGAGTIFVEANSLAFDFAHRRPPWILQASMGLAQRAYDLRRPIRWLLGREASLGREEAQSLDATSVIEPEALKISHPLHLREPRQPGRLAGILQEARDRGVEIVLVVPPRAQTAADHMGAEAQQTLQAHLAALAGNWGLPLFAPAPAWPDSYFVDHAHMNAQGRARFLAEIAQWWHDR